MHQITGLAETEGDVDWSEQAGEYKNEGHHKVPIFFSVVSWINQKPNMMFGTILVKRMLSRFK